MVQTSDGNGRVVDAELVEFERRQAVPETLVNRALELREHHYGFASHTKQTQTQTQSQASLFVSCFRFRFLFLLYGIQFN